MNYMKRLIPVLLLLQFVSQYASAERIFDGHSTSGWTGDVENYEFANGEIRCLEGKGGTIYTEKVYRDFIVELEFKLPPGGNNGLAIRYPGTGNPAYDGMCEIQIIDNDHPKYADLDKRQYHGSAYGMVAAKRGFLKPAGEWNHQKVTVRGSTIKVELNGQVILDTDLATVESYMADKAHPGKNLEMGHFGFAGHKDPVAFRNISIVELD